MNNAIITRFTLIFCSALALSMCIPVTGLMAQPEGNKGIEITPYAGYMFGGKQRYYNGEFKVEGAFTYGAILSVAVQPGAWVEFQYSGAQTTGRSVLYGDIVDDDQVDVGVNYMLIQYRQLWRTGVDEFRPFGLIGAGAAYYNGKGQNSNGDVWAFGASFGLGANYDFSERIGIRVQTRLLMPLTFGGVGFGCGIGTGGAGCGGGVSTYATMVQGDIGGGLVIRF